MAAADLSAFGDATDEPPIARRTLHDEVVARLRDMIIDARLAPGARIHEGQIGAYLGVSRTPLREALKTLASEGLVDIVQGRGAVVRRFSRKDVFDMLEALRLLEQAAGRLACERASDAAVAELAAIHETMLALYRAGRRLEYFKVNQQIHTAIVRLSGNETLAWAHDQIQARMKRIRFIGNESPEKWAAAVAEHDEMVAALQARDGTRLAAVLGRHLERTWERVQDSLDD